MISGFTAVYLTLQVRRRSKLVRAGLGVGVAIWILSLTFGLSARSISFRHGK
jgi:hypothetical protein